MKDHRRIDPIWSKLLNDYHKKEFQWLYLKSDIFIGTYFFQQSIYNSFPYINDNGFREVMFSLLLFNNAILFYYVMYGLATAVINHLHVSGYGLLCLRVFMTADSVP